MTGLCNVSFCIGPFVGVLIANKLAPQATKWSYRGLFVAQWGFGITSVLVSPFMPESVYLPTGISTHKFLTFCLDPRGGSSTREKKKPLSARSAASATQTFPQKSTSPS